ncbi:MAG: TIGR00730 family Rossman fold protein [Betaproteobacteria bacterium]|jgi:uncharacterized protein (TIGR00730 family)|nr:TIGR00730 family Rossman fold protein [Betaproteobacteria bacterium]
MNNICIFCGSNSGRGETYAESARAMVAAIGEAELGIVFGGGNIGLMGVIAEAALAQGVRAVGITPRRLLEREVVHTGLNELHVVESMHERKALMRAQSDAFIALPGGLGTLDELFEVAALTQLGEHHKPCGLLNTSGYFDGLRGFLDHAVAERFVTPVHRDLLVVESDPRRLIAGLRAWKPAQSSKWMDRKA